MMPHSRYTGINEAQLPLAPLNVLVTGIETGPALLVSHDHKNSFLLGHLEYYTETLKEEYLRDKAKGLKTALPKIIFPTSKERSSIAGEGMRPCFSVTGSTKPTSARPMIYRFCQRVLVII